MAATAFGEYFKQLRLQTGSTLRQFCVKNGLKAGNISRLERAVSAPPQSREVLRKYAAALQLEENSEEWQRFFDLAAACSGQLPPDIIDDEEMVARLPLVFRTLRGSKLTQEKLRELAEAIKEA